MEAQRFQVIQGDNEFILSLLLNNEKIRIECQDKNIASCPTFARDYSLSDLRKFSEIFSMTPTILDAQKELNKSIDRQDVTITNKGNILEIIFFIQVNDYSQEITFQLPSIQNNYSPNSINTINTINKPIYKDIPSSYDNMTYPQIEDVNFQNGGYPSLPNEIPLDHERINKIESNSHTLKGDHNAIKQRINELKMKIQMIKKQTSDIKNENGVLNMKSMELKKQYNNLIEAEAALREENADLRKEKHELLLKKNELGFYNMEHNNNASVREVKIPLDEKRKRPTNVSKREKQFGGYTSQTDKNPQIGNMGYSSNTGKINYYNSQQYYK
jgi:hypothetical protein